MLERERLEEALATLGALLEERGEAIGVLIVGGGSLLLLGVVERPTADVDVVGFPSPQLDTQGLIGLLGAEVSDGDL